MSVSIAVVGAGLIGARHAAAAIAARGVSLHAVVDPGEAGAEVGARFGVPRFRALSELIGRSRPDGVVVATPNRLHVDNALECIAAGLPALIEKPLATTLVDAERIVAAGQAAGVPLATGHHRRHNALVARAKALVDEGRLGRITAVQGSIWLRKPDDYFDVEWRRREGAGPIYINLIHDIDLLRHLCGEVVAVHAIESNAIRGHEVEDTAALLLTFAGGALGTVSLSDAIVAPWSWELTARENPAYPATDESCYLIGGTRGSLSLPNLALWSNPHRCGWWEPISATRFPFELEDPLVRQMRQFAAVIRDEQPPLVPAEEGLRNQRVIEAVKESAASGRTIALT